jgi:hypothetical protein
MQTKGGVTMKTRWILGTASVIPLALILVIIGLSGAQPGVSAAPAATLVVNNPADNGPGTLRQAMLDAVSGDTIVFDPAVFPPGSPVSITLLTDLPTLDQGNVTIDGSNAGVILDGIDVTPGHGDGIYITSDGNLIRELQILYFPGDGLEIYGGASNNTVVSNTISGNAYTGINIAGQGTTGNQVRGNVIGADATGTAAIGGNYMTGISIREGAQYNTVAHNLISGNDAGGVVLGGNGTEHNTVSGNYIGTDIGGTYAIPNAGFGVFVNDGAQSNTIGGGSPAERNLVSGNSACGIVIMGVGTDYNVISGNYIGTDVNGAAAIANAEGGISIWLGARYNVVGGLTPGERNVISGNMDLIWAVGVGITGAGTDYNIVIGNYIGTDASGTAALGNGNPGAGISISGGSYNTIGGSATEERNLVSGNQGSGILISGGGTVSNTVSGNYIGTDATGTAVISNTGTGISIGSGALYTLIGGDNATPGGACTGACNVISGNGDDDWAGAGVRIENSGTMSNTVSGNFIGTDVAGTSVLPNGSGISIGDGAQYNRIGGDTAGERNLISGNDGDGIWIGDSGTDHNTVSGNYMGTDTSGATALGGGNILIIGGAEYNTIGGGNATPGGICSGACNLISGNGGGVAIISTHHNVVSGNYIGTDPAGTSAIPNGRGIWIANGAQYNTIGGTMPEERNLISGNNDPIGGPGIWMEGQYTDYNLVIGNYIGTDVNGTVAIPNNGGGVAISGGASYNTVGGDTSAERNLISGNTGGIGISGSHNVVIGNYIGTDITGMGALGNGGGVGVEGAYNRIGGSTPGERNIISGNDAGAVYVSGSDTMSNIVSGNLIGSNVSGTAPIPNGWGVQIWNSAHHNTVGGDTPGEANLISGNNGDAVIINDYATAFNTISGNLIGTDLSGTLPLSNAGHGISMGYASSYNTIGGSTPGARNLISGNGGDGIHIDCNDVVNNTILGNYIGTDISGATAIGNTGHGVNLGCFARQNLIANNLVSGNGINGITIGGFGTVSNTVSQNSIYANSGLGIDLVDGGNTELRAPVVLTYDTAAGTASGIACAGCSVEVFSDEDDEGRWFEGVVTADAGGGWSLDKGSAFVGPHVHATATDGGGNTSEFSAELRDVAVVGAAPDGTVQLGEAVAVRAELYNAGHWTEDQVPIGCSLEDPTGSTVYDENALSGEVPPATWALVDLPAWTPSQEGEHLLACQSQLPEDQDPTNDLFTQTVTAVLCAPDVWMKDNEDDTGDVPTDHPWFWSPDLWVRNQPDGGLDHQNPIPGVENTLYIRLRNRGCAMAEWGQVRLFAGPSRLGWPCLGSEPNVGTIPFVSLASGEERILSIAWIPEGGPYLSLRSVIEAVGDPVQWQPGCSPHQPRFDNNISWRNVHIIDNRADLLQRGKAVKQVEVILNNIYDWPNEVDLVVERMTFPVTGTITVSLPTGLFDRWLTSDGHWSEGIEVLTATAEIRVTGAVSATIGAIPMSASEQATTTLAFDGPAGLAFELGLQERIHDLTVGGVIYQWVVPEGGYEIYLPLVLRSR